MSPGNSYYGCGCQACLEARRAAGLERAVARPALRYLEGLHTALVVITGEWAAIDRAVRDAAAPAPGKCPVDIRIMNSTKMR